MGVLLVYVLIVNRCSLVVGRNGSARNVNENIFIGVTYIIRIKGGRVVSQEENDTYEERKRECGL